MRKLLLFVALTISPLLSIFDYIASGFDIMDPYNLPLFMYNKIHWGSCSTKETYKSYSILDEHQMRRGGLEFTHGIQEILDATGLSATTTKDTICGPSKE